WVIWWFWLGVVFGAVALVNILVRDLPRTEDKVILAVSALFWLVGGVFCYAAEGITIEQTSHEERMPDFAFRRFSAEWEWHSASDFLYPGNRQSLLPPRH
ncbi:MAG: hypothetical protein KGN84_09165, partial [Acidobacteriota bacterium]|nr:hypothetical protein [Acidobacteriota bacterium]